VKCYNLQSFRRERVNSGVPTRVYLATGYAASNTNCRRPRHNEQYSAQSIRNLRYDAESLHAEFGERFLLQQSLKELHFVGPS
jgi:hypothetical protein